MEMTARDFFVSDTGGKIDYIGDDGELLLSVSFPGGKVKCRPYIEMCPAGAKMQVSGGGVIMPPRSGYGVVEHPDMLKLGANPNFKPSSADPAMRQLQQIVGKLQANDARREAKIRQLQSIQHIPKAPPEVKPDEKPDTDLVE